MSDTAAEVAVEKPIVEKKDTPTKDIEDADPLQGEEMDDEDDIEGTPRRTARALDESWDESFKRLQTFKAKHGHCNVRCIRAVVPLSVLTLSLLTRKSFARFSPGSVALPGRSAPGVRFVLSVYRY
jgi:hypothetical protein